VGHIERFFSVEILGGDGENDVLMRVVRAVRIVSSAFDRANEAQGDASEKIGAPEEGPGMREAGKLGRQIFERNIFLRERQEEEADAGNSRGERVHDLLDASEEARRAAVRARRTEAASAEVGSDETRIVVGVVLDFEIGSARGETAEIGWSPSDDGGLFRRKPGWNARRDCGGNGRRKFARPELRVRAPCEKIFFLFLGASGLIWVSFRDMMFHKNAAPFVCWFDFGRSIPVYRRSTFLSIHS
jgi:hypothetical protein